jgi:Domain of unknown function (DUF4091)
VRARFAAVPFDVVPESNQPLWIDVLTPRDVTHGEYTGTITISAEGIRSRRVPIPPIRLKQFREALEDYEYLTILAQLRSRLVAENMVKKIARSWHDWDADARNLLQVRSEIARSISTK